MVFEYLRPCALDKSSLSIDKGHECNIFCQTEPAELTTYLSMPYHDTEYVDCIVDCSIP